MIPKSDSAPPSLRALVVDDREDVTLALSLLLKRLGHDPYVAYHAREALEVGASTRPDVIFLDIGLPDTSGYDVCKDMRQSDWGARSFIVAVTGRNEPADLIQAANSGFDRHVGKPMSLATLQEILRTVVLRSTLPGQPPPANDEPWAFV